MEGQTSLKFLKQNENGSLDFVLYMSVSLAAKDAYLAAHRRDPVNQTLTCWRGIAREIPFFHGRHVINFSIGEVKKCKGDHDFKFVACFQGSNTRLHVEADGVFLFEKGSWKARQVPDSNQTVLDAGSQTFDPDELAMPGGSGWFIFLSKLNP